MSAFPLHFAALPCRGGFIKLCVTARKQIFLLKKKNRKIEGEGGRVARLQTRCEKKNGNPQQNCWKSLSDHSQPTDGGLHPRCPGGRNAVPYLDLLHPWVSDAVQRKAVPHAGVKAMVS